MRSQAEAYALILLAIAAAALLEAAALAPRFESVAQRTLSSEALRSAEQLYVKQGLCLKSSISTTAVLVLAYNSTYTKVVAYSIALSPGAWTCISVEPGLRAAVLTSYGNLFTADSGLKTYKYQ